MKKRLLITSIVMMLVVAVALSTATYAWFTSNTSVSASTINLTAATSNTAAFGISWTNGSYGTSLSNVAAPAENSFNPLVPATYFTDTTTGENAHTQTTTAVQFATATIRQVGGAEKYNSPVTTWSTASDSTNAATPYIWNDGEGGHKSFWIKNLSTNNAQSHLYASATVTGAASDLVRIAIFDSGNLVAILGYTYTYTSAAEATWASGTTYYTHVTNGYLPDTSVTSENFDSKKADLFTRSADSIVAPVYYGTVTANEDVLTTHSNSVKVVDLGSFAALEAREITVYVWLDGKYLDDDTQGTAASIALDFSVTNPFAA